MLHLVIVAHLSAPTITKNNEEKPE